METVFCDLPILPEIIFRKSNVWNDPEWNDVYVLVCPAAHVGLQCRPAAAHDVHPGGQRDSGPVSGGYRSRVLTPTLRDSMMLSNTLLAELRLSFVFFAI